MSLIYKLVKKDIFLKLDYIVSKKHFLFVTTRGNGKIELKSFNFSNKKNSMFVENFFPSFSNLKHFTQAFSRIDSVFLKGFYCELSLRGVGFKSYFLNNNKILFNLGYSHFIFYEISEDVIFYMKKGKLFLYSLDKELLGNVVKSLKNFRVPDVYKAKGIVENNEYFSLKEGKKR
jgi:hypothetical protein